MSRDKRLPEPLRRLAELIEEAERGGVRNASAMALATVDAEGAAAVRMVLLRGLDERGLAFFTNYESAKARDLDRSRSAAAVFYWEALARQVRVSGSVERLPVEESEAYFSRRPRGHRVAAWASRQSEPLAAPDDLVDRVREVEQRFAGTDVPLPPFWGGYLLAPAAIELWSSRESRLHERILYERASDGSWTQRLLQP